MLFTFNIFWKTAAVVGASWLIYGFLGFEFAIVTLLALILTKQWCGNKI